MPNGDASIDSASPQPASLTETDNAHLCIYCRDAFSKWRAPDIEYPGEYNGPHHNLEDLRLSALEGCPLCELLFDNYEWSYGYDASISIEPTEPFQCELYEYAGSYNFHLAGFYKCVVDLIIRLDPSTYSDPYSKPGIPAEETDCPETWSLTHEWMQNCTTQHELCQIRGDDTLVRRLPKRLVDTGSGENTEQKDLRLCMSNTLPLETPYLSLSHCWGKAQFTRLLKSNVEGMLGQIEPTTLSKTFQDAIAITKKLGYRYIWIDALCIIQDDAKDWNIEAATMGDVVGCLNPRPPQRRPGCKLNAYADDESGSRIMWNCYSRKVSGGLATFSEVAKRSWVFQERCLAPRTIFFGQYETSWECRQVRACESFRGGILQRESTISSLVASWPRARDGLTISDFAMRDLAKRKWDRVIAEYTGGELTYESDILVALSGITARFACTFNTSYLAGLWRENLEWQLGWFVPGVVISDLQERNLLPAKMRQQRPKYYRAPSWSWASVKGSVRVTSYFWTPPKQVGKAFITIEVASVTLQGPNQFGQVSDGFIKLHCRALLPVHFICSADDVVIAGVTISPVVAYPDTNPSEFEGELFCMHLTEHSAGDNMHWGMVLKLSSPGTFRRAGMFEILDKAKSSFEVLYGDETVLERRYRGVEVSGKDGDGHDTYCITLI